MAHRTSLRSGAKRTQTDISRHSDSIRSPPAPSRSPRTPLISEEPFNRPPIDRLIEEERCKRLAEAAGTEAEFLEAASSGSAKAQRILLEKAVIPKEVLSYLIESGATKAVRSIARERAQRRNDESSIEPRASHVAKKLALTVRQPWASLIMAGIKDIENRSWRTNYRGQLFIHAGLTIDRETMSQHGHLLSDYPCGVILGTVELIDCLLNYDSPWAETNQWHWVVRKPRFLDTPVVAKGKLGLWTPTVTADWIKQ